MCESALQIRALHVSHVYARLYVCMYVCVFVSLYVCMFVCIFIILFIIFSICMITHSIFSFFFFKCVFFVECYACNFIFVCLFVCFFFRRLAGLGLQDVIPMSITKLVNLREL